MLREDARSLRREEAELWRSLGEQLFRNLRHWEARLVDLDEYLHARVRGSETGEATEGVIAILHLSRISPKRRPPRPDLQVWLREIEARGRVSEPVGFTLDMTTGRLSGNREETLSLAKLVALTDPGLAETEIVRRDEFDASGG